MEFQENGTPHKAGENTPNDKLLGSAGQENSLKARRASGKSKTENRPDVKDLRPLPQLGDENGQPGSASLKKTPANSGEQTNGNGAKHVPAITGTESGQEKGVEGNGKPDLSGDHENYGLTTLQNSGTGGDSNAQSLSLSRTDENITAPTAKPEMTLDTKLRAISDLHRKSIQRFALIARIKTLEDFEVQLIEEGDELESNPYHGCKLIIQDDKKREFVTNTPGLIRMVTQYIFEACLDKLQEIEDTIFFPQA